jgi:hypothetical protein
MSSLPIDHKALGRSRIATQYLDSTKFLAFIEALLTPLQELEDVFQQISMLPDIDWAEGINLDVIGDIVGVDRVIPDAIPVQFFGFEGQPGATVFGEEDVPGIGSRFRDEDESDAVTSVLADPEYRLLIRAQIVKNHAKSTNEDVIAGLSYLFSATRIVVEDLGGMGIGISIGRELTFLEKAMVTNLDILPRAQGVRIKWRSTFDATNYFGFDGQPGALSFGEEGQPTVGGLFAEEF